MEAFLAIDQGTIAFATVCPVHDGLPTAVPARVVAIVLAAK
jgi:hypothetical protein